MKISKEIFFKRQIVLPNFGIEGQAKLQAAHVAIVGQGGLGNPASVALGLAGVGKLRLIDFDRIDESNLHRQFLYSANDLGQNKVDIAKSRLQAIAPFSSIEAINQKLHVNNALELFSQVDLILDCSDNFETKFLLHDMAQYMKIPLVQTSIYQCEGQILIFDFKRPESPCFRCLYPEKIDNGCVGSCAEVGVLGATAMLFGSLQAKISVDILLGISDLKQGEVLTFDLTTLETIRHMFPRDLHCPNCTGERPFAKIQQEYLNSISIELRQALLGPEKYIWVDIREAGEIKPKDYDQLAGKDIRQLCIENDLLQHLKQSEKYLFFCARGHRSDRLVKHLRSQKMDNVFSLASGLSLLE